MTEPSVAARAWLSALRICRVATVSAAGAPLCVPVIYAYNAERNTLTFMSGMSRKTRDIAATGVVAVAVDDGRTFRGVSLRGSARVVTGGAELDEIRERMLARGLLSRERAASDQVAVVVTPSWWSEWGLHAAAGQKTAGGAGAEAQR